MLGQAFAVPAYPEKIRFVQPRGEVTLSIYLKGDERVHWAESEDGYSLLHGDDGALYYAESDNRGGMRASEYLATDIKERSAEVAEFLRGVPKHLMYSMEQIKEMKRIWEMVEASKKGPKSMSNVLGEKKFLVILFGFQDKDFQYGKLDFRRMFNQVNYSVNGATGSVKDYYREVSHGLFSLTVDVAGPYIGSENTSYYGSDDWGSQYFAREAVDSAAKDVDFSEYDNDGDGYIDGLHIIFAGHGEEAGGSSSLIWSHKWNIFDAPTYNNTVVDVYSCSPELSGNMGSEMTRIGVICHELGHVFGAPDYYDTDYGQSGGQYPGLGSWDIMSSGSWNHGGVTPAHHNAYTKLFIYHWAECDTLNGQAGVYEMRAVDETNDNIHRINTSTEGDFFLLENRQKIKWDRYAPGHGLLVYHVGTGAHGASVSNRKHPQDIYIVAHTADTFPNTDPASYGYLSSDRATLSDLRDSLTDLSVPWFRPWSKQPNGNPIYHVSENAVTKKVFFTLLDAQPEPMDVEAEAFSNSTIQLNWRRYGSYNTVVVMSETESFGTPTATSLVGDTLEGGGIVIYRGNGDRMTVDSLERNKEYHFKFFSNWKATHFSDGVVRTARTLDCDMSDWTLEDFEETEIGQLPSCWTGAGRVEETADLGKAMVLQADSTAEKGWRSVTTSPINYDSVQGYVMHFQYLFGEGCEDGDQILVEARKNIAGDWETVGNYEWRYGMATVNDAYIHMADMGDMSKIRFSYYGNNGTLAALDNIELTAGALVLAECDENGTIEPGGYSIVGAGDSITFTIRAAGGYMLKSIKKNGAQLAPTMYSTDTNGITTLRMGGLSNSNTIFAEFERNVGIVAAEAVELRVYPNPTNGLVTVEATEGDEVMVFNALGQVVARQKNDGSALTIDLSEQPRGIYLVRSGAGRAKIVKK